MRESRQKQYDKTYLKMAKVLSELSYAYRNKVGCIIVSDKGQIIAQGWNGTPQGMDNCCEHVLCTRNEWLKNFCIKKPSLQINDVVNNSIYVGYCHDCEYGKLMTKKEVLHAESNAISKCAKWLSSTENATLYVTLSPCFDCAKLIIQSGIKKVVYNELYRDASGIELLKNNDIDVEQIEI